MPFPAPHFESRVLPALAVPTREGEQPFKIKILDRDERLSGNGLPTRNGITIVRRIQMP